IAAARTGPDRRHQGARVARAPDALVRIGAKPSCSVGDNGTVATSRAILQRADRNAVPRHDIDHGKPQQNALIVSFNGSLRGELPNEELFDTPDDARRKRALRRTGDTAVRPHTGRRSQRRALGQFDGAAPPRLPDTTGPTTNPIPANSPYDRRTGGGQAIADGRYPRTDPGMAARRQSPPTSPGPWEHPARRVRGKDGAGDARRDASEINLRTLRQFAAESAPGHPMFRALARRAHDPSMTL
ncbi:integrase core domain-containing protein, partial [Palleronia rufa]|uniref:integrase core domain-containing protein n=1 Tax=Palleronia rufa TaxID=1530186 RepID=UPI0039EE1F48